ncbi:MAG TPA: hypothetical protein VF283_17035 [Bryobacteraceae bacterium]
MSKQEEAGLILKLYELRREETLRKAREWYFRDFNPESMADITQAMSTDKSAYLRMVLSYWEMAAGLVNHGAISQELFNDTNGEHLATFAKIEPFLTEARATFHPGYLANLEKLIDATPDGRQKVAKIRERIAAQIRARVAAQRAGASPQG